jgi:hypothetical protein
MNESKFKIFECCLILIAHLFYCPLAAVRKRQPAITKYPGTCKSAAAVKQINGQQFIQ